MKLFNVFIIVFLSAIGLFLFTSISGDSHHQPYSTNDSTRNIYYPHTTYQPVIPTSLSFCGEEVPLNRSDVYESLDREMLSNTFWHTNTMLVLKRSKRFFPIIERILSEYKIPNDFKYLCVAESNLMPLAKSPVGAVGLWQIMSTTGKELGLEINDEVDERYNIEKSTIAACKFLQKSYNSLGSWTLVAASYNGGLARVNKNISTQLQKSYYDILWVEETGRYVYRILSLKVIFENPRKYGFNLDETEYYEPYEYTEIKVDSTITNFAQFAIDNKTTYKGLKNLNPWLRDTKLTNAKRKTYTIQIPK